MSTLNQMLRPSEGARTLGDFGHRGWASTVSRLKPFVVWLEEKGGFRGARPGRSTRPHGTLGLGGLGLGAAGKKLGSRASNGSWWAARDLCR